MRVRLLIILFAFALAGCQSPRTIYTNGVIVWCSTSAVGFGFGEYIEVPAGGELDRVSTNSAPCLWKEGLTSAGSDIAIRNGRVKTDPETPAEKDGLEAADADKAEVE